MKISEDVMISNNGFVFDATIGESYISNSLGLEIIELLKQNKSKKEIQGVIIQKYDVDSITVERDLEDFFSNMKRFNLIQ